MKAFAAALTGLVAAVSAEAEPWLGYGLGVPAVGLPVPAAPLVAHPNGAVTPDYTPAQKVAAADHFHAKAITYATRGPYLGLGHGLWKREAEAEPWLGYGLGAWGYGLKSAPCVNAANLPVPCAGLGLGHGLWKREAEAEPWLGYGLGAWGLGLKSAPCVNALNIPVPCAGKKKRDAEAEPWLVGGWGYGLWSPCRNAWGAAVPCAGKKKRDADAQLIYGAGYGLPALGYGYGIGAPILTIKSDCKNAYGIPVPCAAETPAEEAAPAEVEKRSADADAQLYLGAGWPWGPLVHSSNLGICTNVAGEQVPC